MHTYKNLYKKINNSNLEHRYDFINKDIFISFFFIYKIKIIVKKSTEIQYIMQPYKDKENNYIPKAVRIIN